MSDYGHSLQMDLIKMNGEAEAMQNIILSLPPMNVSNKIMDSEGAFDAWSREYRNAWREGKHERMDREEKQRGEFQSEMDAWDNAHPVWTNSRHGGVASAAGTYTLPPYSNHGIGVNVGGGVGLMSNSIEVNAGVFTNFYGIGQAYFSYGVSNSTPLYLNGGISAQLLYIKSQADKIDLSGDGKTVGLGGGPVAGSYSYATDKDGKKTRIFGAGIGAGIKVSGGFTDTKTYTMLFLNWWPSMRLHIP